MWQAVKASSACGHLPLAAALQVDSLLVQALQTLPFGQVMKRLDEWIIAADPGLAEERAEAKRQARFIRISPIEDGHVTIYGIVDADEGILFDSILKRVAATLPQNLNADSFADHEIRRAQALGYICRACPPVLQSSAERTAGTASDDSDGLHDPAQTPPTRTLIVHINANDAALTSTPAGVARVGGWGPLLTSDLPEFLKSSKVVVRPIIEAATIRPTDSYQVPEKMRFVIEQRNPIDVFPYGSTAAKHCDQDHTIAYSRSENAPPGQTRLENLGPLSRTAHRAKTHGGWQLNQPAPGRFIWTSRLGYQYCVTPSGTTRIRVPVPE